MEPETGVVGGNSLENHASLKEIVGVNGAVRVDNRLNSSDPHMHIVVHFFQESSETQRALSEVLNGVLLLDDRFGAGNKIVKGLFLCRLHHHKLHLGV